MQPSSRTILRNAAHQPPIRRHLRGCFLLRNLFYHDATDVNDPEARELAALRIIAKMPTLAAIAYKTSVGAQGLQHTARCGRGST